MRKTHGWNLKFDKAKATIKNKQTNPRVEKYNNWTEKFPRVVQLQTCDQVLKLTQWICKLVVEIKSEEHKEKRMKKSE